MSATHRKSRALTPPQGYDDAFASLRLDLSDQLKAFAKAANQILQISASYRSRVARLNKEYVSADDKRLEGIMKFNPNDDGELTTGPFKGRHTLVFTHLTEGNRFVRVGSSRTKSTGFNFSDFIFLSFPMGEFPSPESRGKIIGPLAASLAHETVHAHHRFTRSTPGPSLLRQDRADEFINEEIDTREKEQTILKEVLSSKKRTEFEAAEKRAKSTGLRELIQNRIDTMLLSRAEVQRDFVSGTNLTSLETFVIEEMTDQSLRAKNLNSTKIEESQTLVRELVFTDSLDKVLQVADPSSLTRDKEGNPVSLPNEFAEFLLIRRVIDEDWQTSGDDPEAIVERHRKALSRDNSPGEFHYEPLP